MPAITSQRLIRTGVVIGVCAVLIRLLGPAWRSAFPLTFPDSYSYRDVAAKSPLRPSFWFADRPPTYPLLWWTVGRGTRAIVVTQTVIWVLAWGWLISTVARTVRSPAIRWMTVVVLVAIAVETRWVLWNMAVLTESLSASLAIAAFTAWWRWLDHPRRFRTVVAVVLTAAWMLLRDSNAVALGIVVVPTAVAAVVMLQRRLTPMRRNFAIAATVLLVVFAYSLIAQMTTDRGETSFHNNVGLRWLQDDSMRDYFESHGMPISPALLDRAGHDAWADGEQFLRSPELAEYREWADTRGRWAAALSLVWRSDWYVSHLLDNLPAQAANDQLAYDTFSVGSKFPDRPLGPLDPVASRGSMASWGVLLIAAAGVTWRRRRPLGVFLMGASATVLIDGYVSFAGDAVEVGRHMAGPLFRWSVLVVVAVACAADALLERPRRAFAPVAIADEPLDDVDLDPVGVAGA